MKNKKTEANICMVISKTFSGLNMNALKYLLPLWISPLTGVTLRCTFAAIAFWIIGFFVPKENTTRKEKGILFLLGALGIYGFMLPYRAQQDYTGFEFHIFFTAADMGLCHSGSFLSRTYHQDEDYRDSGRTGRGLALYLYSKERRFGI